MKRQYIDEIKAVVIAAIAIILLASFISFVPEDLPWYTSHPNVPAKNLIRIFGAYIAGVLFFMFGYGAYFLVAALCIWSWGKFASKDMHSSWSKLLSLAVMFCVSSSVFGMIGSPVMSARFQRAGIVGSVTSDFLMQYFGRVGAFVILVTVGVLTLIVIGEFLVSPFLFKASKNFGIWLESFTAWINEKRKNIFSKKPQTNIRENGIAKTVQRTVRNPVPMQQKEASAPNPVTPKPFTSKKPDIRISDTPKKELLTVVRSEKQLIVGDYHLPSLDLLEDSPSVPAGRVQGDLMSGAKVLEETLSDFGVSARVADIEKGPVITRYELEPAPGVKVQKITTLSDDIALAMKAQTIRIVAPIPGKNRVGVEVPNSSSSLVYLKEILVDSKWQRGTSKLMLALGKDTAGKSIIADLVGMPHLLIAGTTGSGKTVCVNSLIMSILFRSTPQEVKLLMIDPKMVELSIYNKIPHAICPAITDPKKVSAALNWVVGEMESRYALLAEEGVRNIKAYNSREQRLPYIVVIIDELADLMQVSAKQIESAITRLAQLSRAVGIHLILATQRPSVDVITGVIKANFPARISFKVASKVDSRTVLDMNGADKLLGKGDMLFIQPGEAKPTRGQCSLVSDKEIQGVIDFLKSQQDPVYDDAVLKRQSSAASGRIEEKDELYDEALKLVIETNQASVSILQRRMRLGYTRAARLIDMMEQDGMIGPYCGSKPREILINREEWLMKHMGDDA